MYPKALLKEQKPPLTSVLKVWGDPKTPISLNSGIYLGRL